jgi:RND family efflux transporter MFP subunit
MNKKIVITVVVIVAVVILGIKGKGLLEKRKEEVVNEALPSTAQVSVQVVKAKQGDLKNSVSFLAQILSDKSIKLSTKLAGYVDKVMIEEAQEVKKGDVLVMIDAVELKSNIKALQSTLQAQKNDANVAQNIYNRNKKLYKVGGLAKEKLEISKATLETKRAMIDNSRQKIDQLKHQLSYLKIVAPFDGVIDAILLHEGDLAAAGKPIVAMSNGEKKLVFSYAPSEKNSIAKGQTVFYKGQKIGIMKSIYPTSKNGLSIAEVSLLEKLPLPVGTSINIDVLTQESHGCMLPADTILHKKDGTFVMVYNGKSFSSMQVNVEIETKDEMIVTPCPNTFAARGSEVKLSKLQAYDNVNILGEKDAK